jgi:hypothetical protein
MIGRQFIWANSLLEPTYEKLDHVLMDLDWELKFPLVSVRALPRILKHCRTMRLFYYQPGTQILIVDVHSNLISDGFKGRGSGI